MPRRPAVRGADFLVSLLGNDGLARNPCHDRRARAGVPDAAGEARKIFRSLPHAGGGRGIVLALRRHRLDLFVSAPVLDSSLRMNPPIVPKKIYWRIWIALMALLLATWG